MEEIVRAVTRSLRFMDMLAFVELVERAPRIEGNCYITTAPEIREIGLRPEWFKSAGKIEEDIIWRLDLRLK